VAGTTSPIPMTPSPILVALSAISPEAYTRQEAAQKPIWQD
jgi:hypothetical protein